MSFHVFTALFIFNLFIAEQYSMIQAASQFISLTFNAVFSNAGIDASSSQEELAPQLLAVL